MTEPSTDPQLEEFLEIRKPGAHLEDGVVDDDFVLMLGVDLHHYPKFSRVDDDLRGDSYRQGLALSLAESVMSKRRLATCISSPRSVSSSRSATSGCTTVAPIVAPMTAIRTRESALAVPSRSP